MECSCEIDMDVSEGDSPIIRENHYQPNREKDCTECKEGVLSPGDSGVFYAFKYKDSTDRAYLCPDCKQITEVFFNSYYFGSIWEDLQEAISQEDIAATESCLTRLSKSNRDAVCEIVEELWDDQLVNGKCDENGEEA
jgi:hypothetical protein